MGFVFEQDRVRGGYYWTPVRSEWQCLDLRGRIAAQSNQATRALSSDGARRFHTLPDKSEWLHLPSESVALQVGAILSDRRPHRGLPVHRVQGAALQGKEDLSPVDL